jgi:hypothetical protein
VRAYFAVVLAAAFLAGCGAGSGGGREGAPPSGGTSAAAAAKIERCVDRLLSRATNGAASEEVMRRYAEDTYCARFARNGWVYADGALSIAAQKWVEQSGTCATSRAGGGTRTIPCEQASPPGVPRILDCALLHHVRRREVRGYIEKLQRRGEVECDDRTPIEELGVP